MDRSEINRALAKAMGTMAKLLAMALGWREAWDYDQRPALLVVHHPARGIHFTGRDAWWRALRFGGV